MKHKKQKAFLGAIIGAGAGILGSVLQGIGQRKQQRLEQAKQVKKETIQQAGAIQESISGQAGDEFFENKITLKNGGKINMDRIKRVKKFACGGRSKKINGGSKFGNFLRSDAGNATIGAIGTIGSGLISAFSSNKPIEENSAADFGKAKNTITPNSYDNIGAATMNIAKQNNNIIYKDRLQQQKFGGKRMIKRTKC